MGKILSFIYIFLILTLNCYASGEKVAYYYDKLNSDKKVKKIESLLAKDGVIIINGLFYDKVRIDKVYIKNGREKESNAEIIFTTKDIEDAFLNKNKDIKSIKITTTKNSLIAKGEVHVMGGNFNISVEGFFSVKDGSIYCTLKNAKFGYLKVPKWVVKKLNSKLNPFFSFSELGIKIKTSEITFEENKIIIE